ncbi:helix-turn-helix transcriptional regulator [Brevibacillus migulae]|uniref:helix-turn-helix transcriptional regulator n=1 Tax=Brevibacillus migulae TaxID=1644114 RepID=UPI00106E436B|nr:YafY family protein [Brevibacillus migulae]
MRADRLLSILLLLQKHGQMTTSQLAAQLEVSVRTMHRDLEALSSAGFPIYAERGKLGGWRLLEQYQTKLTLLGMDELPALFLPIPLPLLRDLGMEKDVQLARLKLLETLPEKQRSNAESIHQRIYIDTGNWHAKEEDLSRLPLLQTAIWEERLLVIHYARADREQRERIVSPLGLVAKGNVWYLIAMAENDVRTYRVNRITDAKLLDERFVRPEAFDLRAYWEDSSRQFVERLPQYHVVARVQDSIIDQLSYAGRYPLITLVEERDETGWLTLSLQFQIEHEACAFLMGFGSKIEVLKPHALRERISRLAEELLRLYPGTASLEGEE